MWASVRQHKEKEGPQCKGSDHITSHAVGQPMLIRNHGLGPRWMTGVTTKANGPLSFEIEIQDGW